MKQFKERFNILLDDKAIDQKVRIDPTPLVGLGSVSVDAACLRLEKSLKEVFIPTPQIRQLLRLFYSIALEHVDNWYADEATYIRRCYQRDLTRSPTWLTTALSGLAGVGKSELIKALSRLLVDRSEMIEIPGLPRYPMQTSWAMTMRQGGNLSQLLKPFLDCGDGYPKVKFADDVLIPAAKRAHTCGAAVIFVDEFQFITSSSDAHAKAAKTLMKLELIGPPLVYCANYSMINKLQKRPQQERQRLLAKVKFLYPDPAGSEAWLNSLEGQINVAPEAFSSDRAISASRNGETIHKYTFGLKRLTAQLLNIGYRHSRESRDGVVCPSDIEWAYKSSFYSDQRKDVGLLIQQTIERESARDDLWCDMAEFREENVIQATQAIKEHRSRITQELAKSSMNKKDREDYELVIDSQKQPAGDKAKVVPIKRGKLTKDSLLEGSKAFLDKYDMPN